MARQVIDPPDQDNAPRHQPALAIARQRVQRRRRRRLPIWPFALAAAVILLPLAGIAALFSLAGTSATAAAVSLSLLDKTMGQIPPAHQFPADSLVYDRSNQLLADLHPDGETRLPVTLAQIALPLQQATVDTEDRNFYHEGAIDPTRIVSAALNDIRHRNGGGLQGASTITQQLAKVQYLSDAPTLARKVRELFVARHIESTRSKQQILQDYLNDIPYGHGATGIQAAAHTYFGIDASKLTLPESALLAGLPDAPSELDPIAHPDAAKSRQRVVLDAMVQAGDLTPDQANQAYTQQLSYAKGNADDVDLQPAFVNRVKQELASQVKLDPNQAGLRITTTLDPKLQQVAQSTVAKQVHAIAADDVTDGALVSIDPTTGEVLAYVGSAGPGTPGGQIDMAAVPRQPGSTFKLFTYSSALNQRKLTMLTPVLDAPLSLPTGGGPGGQGAYVVRNYDLRYHGMLPVEQALGNSLNVPAVKVELLAGVPNVVLTARAMGVTTLDKDPASYTPSLTLGSYPVPLWEMAQAATTFATGGKERPARFVTSVKNAAGKELLPPPAAAHQALDPGTVFIMNQILTNDANRVLEFGPHSALTLPDHTVAAKTGTTNDFKDNLTIGWTPKLVTATWVGNADDHAMKGTTGVTGAAPIWHDVMEKALAGQPDNWPGPPADVHPITFDGAAGYVLDNTTVTYIPALTGGRSGAMEPRPAVRTEPAPARPRPAPSASASSAPAAAATQAPSPAATSGSPSASPPASPSGAQSPPSAGPSSAPPAAASPPAAQPAPSAQPKPALGKH